MRSRGKITFFIELVLASVVFVAFLAANPLPARGGGEYIIEKLSEEAMSKVILEDLEGFKKVTSDLRNEIFKRGVLSLSDFADRAYGLTENKPLNVRKAFIREALKVSPLDVKFWLYLSLSDLISLRIFDVPSDLINLFYGSLKNPVSLVKTVFIGIGIASLVVLVFTFFFAMGIFFKYYQNLVADITSGKPLEKLRILILPLVLLVFGVLFLVLRSPLFVLFLILTLFTPYMIHRELVVTIVIGLVIAFLALGFEQTRGLGPVAVTGAGGEVIEVAYGILPSTGGFPSEIEYPGFRKLVEMRKAFFRGDYRAAARAAKELSKRVSEKFSMYEAISKYYYGDRSGALEEAKRIYEKYPSDPVVVFNLYQLYLASFKFDKAQEIQDGALEGISRLRPYSITPENIKEGVLIPPEVDLDFLFGAIKSREREMRDVPFTAMWRVRGIPSTRAYLACLFLIFLLRIVTFNRYLHSACKACGERQPWKVRFKRDDVCGVCSSKTHHVKGTVLVPDKILGIRLYRKATILRSLLIPGYPLLSVNAVTVFSGGILLNSLFTSLVLVFAFAFPREFSPLYERIYSLGVLVSCAGLVLSYLGTNVFGLAVFRRVLKKYRVWEI